MLCVAFSGDGRDLFTAAFVNDIRGQGGIVLLCSSKYGIKAQSPLFHGFIERNTGKTPAVVHNKIGI